MPFPTALCLATAQRNIILGINCFDYTDLHGGSSSGVRINVRLAVVKEKHFSSICMTSFIDWNSVLFAWSWSIANWTWSIQVSLVQNRQTVDLTCCKLPSFFILNMVEHDAEALTATEQYVWRFSIGIWLTSSLMIFLSFFSVHSSWTGVQSDWEGDWGPQQASFCWN